MFCYKGDTFYFHSKILKKFIYDEETTESSLLRIILMPII
jgi:hypothetical protein